MKTFFTLIDQSYDTHEQAIAAEKALIEAGYPLAGEYIQQWWVDAAGSVVSLPPKDCRGVELLAEQRNSLIDFIGD